MKDTGHTLELKDPKAQEKMDSTEKAMRIGVDIMRSSLETMGFKLDEKQVARFELNYAMSVMAVITNM